MSDNITVTAGIGTTVATDEVGAVHFQKIKLDAGGDGVSVPVLAGQQLAAASIPVVLSSDQAGTVNIADPTTGKKVAVESNGALAVNIQDQHSETVDLYLYRLDASPTLTSSIAVDDVVFDIDTNADISNEDVITIYEGTYFYQALVTSSTAITVTVSTPCDKVFTIAATVHIGPWNMAVNGSITPQAFHVHPPVGLDFDIYGLTISGLDELSMDSTTFLGIEGGITNGLLLRQINTITKNLGLIVNNLGFEEFGYDVTYTAANKQSEYGVIIRQNLHITNGVSLRLEGATQDTIQAIIRDDLTSQSLMAMIIKGHVVTN